MKDSLIKTPQCSQRFLVILLLSAMLSVGSGAQAAPEVKTPADITAALQPFVDHHIMAGAVTLVATKDKVLSLNAVGWADVAANKPMAPDTLFWIASQSKPMTSTALMMLVDEGKVKLDDPVEKYLPEFKGQMYTAEKDADHILLKKPGHPILVRNILSHTSGLPPTSPVENPTLDMLPLAAAVKSYAMSALKFDPDTNWDYSNAGINTAGRIIEVVSGMPYQQFMEDRLFKPLGMKDTTFFPTEEQVQRLAKSYRADGTGLAETTIIQLFYPLTDRRRQPMPAGGLFSTASDVARFCQMILSGGTYEGKRYVSESAVNQMTKKETGEALKQSYGFGWGVGGGFGHGGAYKTDMHVNPQLGLITVFMVQQAGDWPSKEGDRILSAFTAAANRLALNSPAFLQMPVAQPQGAVEIQDHFDYTTADINQHAPSVGKGTWSTNCANGSVISTDGTRALIQAGEDDTATASFPLEARPDTLYSLVVTCDFAGPRPTDCWAGLGFSSGTGGNDTNVDCPWMLIRPQRAVDEDGVAVGFSTDAGKPNSVVGDWTVYAPFYPTVSAMITLDTKTNESVYYLNGRIQGRTVIHSPQIHDFFFKGFRMGHTLSVKNVTLTVTPSPASP